MPSQMNGRTPCPPTAITIWIRPTEAAEEEEEAGEAEKVEPNAVVGISPQRDGQDDNRDNNRDNNAEKEWSLKWKKNHLDRYGANEGVNPRICMKVKETLNILKDIGPGAFMEFKKLWTASGIGFMRLLQ